MMRSFATGLGFLLSAAGVAYGARAELEGLPLRTWGGATIRPAVRVADVAEGEELHLVWALTSHEYVVQGEVTGVTGSGVTALAISLPEVPARVRITLHVQLFRGQTLVTETERQFELFPTGLPADMAAAYGERDIGVIGARPEDDPMAQRFPFRFQQLASAVAVRHFDGKLILLVGDAPLSRRSGLTTALVERVEEGLSVAWLGGVAGRLPLDGATQEIGPIEAKEVRVLAPEHAVLANLRPGDLTNWGRDGVVARDLVPWPTAGNHTTILDASSDAEPRAVAVELRHGPGRILCCGLAVTEKLQEEPVAEIVLANLVRWGLTQSEPLRDPYGCFAASSGVRPALVKLGVEFLQGRPLKGDVLIADSSLLSEENRALCADLLRVGGTIVLFHLAQPDVGLLNSLLDKRWGRDVRGQAPRLAIELADAASLRDLAGPVPHPLLAGVRPEDLRSLTPGEEQEQAWALRAITNKEHWRSLIGEGLVAKLEREDVRIVFWQLPLQEEDIEPQSRVLSALLTNLGVRLNPSE